MGDILFAFAILRPLVCKTIEFYLCSEYIAWVEYSHARLSHGFFVQLGLDDHDMILGTYVLHSH